MTSLLPINATSAELALEKATERVDAIPVPIHQLWSAESCPVELLPWLAWALSVDEWDPNWSEATKRAVIAASFEVHSRKGTVSSVRRHLASMGYGDATIIEYATAPRRGDDPETSLRRGGGPLDGVPWYPTLTRQENGDVVITDETDYNQLAIEDGLVRHDLGHWTEYQVIVTKPLRVEDAETLAERLRRVAPVRCRLVRVSSTVIINRDAQFTRDDGWSRDSTYSLEA